MISLKRGATSFPVSETVIRGLPSRKPLSKEFLQPDIYKDDAPLQKLIKEGWFEQLRK